MASNTTAAAAAAPTTTTATIAEESGFKWIKQTKRRFIVFDLPYKASSYFS